MEANLRIDGDQEMHMIWHHLHLDDLGVPLARRFAKDGFQPFINPINQYPASLQ